MLQFMGSQTAGHDLETEQLSYRYYSKHFTYINSVIVTHVIDEEIYIQRD